MKIPLILTKIKYEPKLTLTDFNVNDD